MTKKFDYGITHTPHQGEAVNSVHVAFGDGKTGIQALGFDNGFVGVVMCRDGKHNIPFGFNEDKDTHKSENEKVFVVFDNAKSIEVLIARLVEAKEFLLSN